MMHHQTHLVTFSTISNHSYDFNYNPIDSNTPDNNMKDAFAFKDQKGIKWGEENINADEAFEGEDNEDLLQSNENTIEYEEGKWTGLELEGCNMMELVGNKNRISSDQAASKPLKTKTKSKSKKKIRITIKRPFDLSQLRICTYQTEIIDKATNPNIEGTIFDKDKDKDKDIDFYQEKFKEYITKNGFVDMKGLSEEEKVKKMEIVRLAFWEFSRLKKEEINRLVEEELEKRIKEKTVDGHISQEEEQKIWEDLSNQYNVLIPQAPPYINLQCLFDSHRKEQQRNYRISKGSTIEVIDDLFKSNQSSISGSYSGSDDSDINQLNEHLSQKANSEAVAGGKKKKKKGHHHHRRKGKEIAKALGQLDEQKENSLDNKTIVLDKLKKLNESDIHSTHTEIKRPQTKRIEEDGDGDNNNEMHRCRTFNKKNNACCPYCRRDKSNSSYTNENIHQSHDNKEEVDKINELKNELTNKYEDNDNDNEYNNIDTDSNEESDNANDNNGNNNKDGIYDTEDEENKTIRESDKDSETKRKEAREKKKEKEKAKLKAKKKSMIKPNLFVSKKKSEVAKKAEIKPQQKRQQPKKQQEQRIEILKKESLLPNYLAPNSKKTEIPINNNISNHAKVKKVMQSLHKQASITADNRIKLSPNISQNQNISTRLKNQIDKGKELPNKVSIMNNNNIEAAKSNNKNTTQNIHNRNLSQQVIKPPTHQKKLNLTNHEANTISKPSYSINHNNDSNLTNLPFAKTNRTQKEWKKVPKTQLSAASTIAPITSTNFYNAKKIDYITNKDLNFGFEFWKENMKNSCFSTKNSRCNSGQQRNVIEEEEKNQKPAKRKTFSNLTDEELERKKKQISELMKNRSNPYSLYWPDKFMSNACQMGLTSYKSINGVPIITLFKKKEETIDEMYNQIQQELHKQKQLEMSKYHNKSSLSFHPYLDKVNAELDQEKNDKYKTIQYPQILKYFN